MKKLMIVFGLFFVASSTQAQYDRYSSRDYDDTYSRNSYDYYDDNFDWRWDVRVRISDGTNSGRLTRREANRLYEFLEDIERREYAYQSDGHYSSFEQDEIWGDVQALHRRIGLELRDGDRVFYGYSPIGVNFRGFNWWFYRGGYNFNRFDLRGFGNTRLGYGRRGHERFDNRRFDNHRGYDHDRNRGRNEQRADGRRGNDRPSREMNDRDRRGNGNFGQQNFPRAENRINTPRQPELERAMPAEQPRGSRTPDVESSRPRREERERPQVIDRQIQNRTESMKRPENEAPRERANGRRGGVE